MKKDFVIIKDEIKFETNKENQIVYAWYEDKKLPKLPAKIMHLLIENPNELVTLDELCESCYGVEVSDYYMVRSIDTQLSTKVRPFVKDFGWRIDRVKGEGIILVTG